MDSFTDFKEMPILTGFGARWPRDFEMFLQKKRKFYTVSSPVKM